MTKDCYIENNIDIQKGPVQVAKERSSISQRLIFNSNSSSKSNKDCMAEVIKIRINNINNVIMATS